MSKPTFVVVARENSGKKTMILAVKEKDVSEAEGRVAQYIRNTTTGETYSIQAKYTIYDVNHVQLLEIKQ